ncbi:MAG: YggS family pyridoxal phosphate-dependent enzyme [Candidatus Eisenbacteria bacterium]|nr:YggS family pyridoxal phosphate-dependent enzyme [Candidatus Eisenbacteria bacterium]
MVIDLRNTIEANLDALRGRVDECLVKAGRAGEDVTVVAVSKTVSLDAILLAVELGVTDVGENKVQEALEKIPAGTRRSNMPRWHMVGHLQTNKVKPAVQLFDVVQSVDSNRIAKELSKRAKEEGKNIDVLVEVNTSGETTKFGVFAEAAEKLIEEISDLDSISVKGLMTVGPLGEDEEARASFRTLRRLFEKIGKKGIGGVQMKYLSMGMTDDFESALEEGSNMIRIGRAIFGPRTS